jgi:hypothetical protein
LKVMTSGRQRVASQGRQRPPGPDAACSAA